MMAVALGRKDKYTQIHAQRVAAYAKRLASRMALSPTEIHRITLGGMLHDVGKLALSDRIFSNHQKNLSQKMWGEVRNHPLIGAALLEQINCRGTIRDIVLYHHERMDGSGYPFGLVGSQIPLSAKIVSVADCFDAITTDRPYQKRKGLGRALGILSEMAGTCLSADLVAILVKDIQCNGMVPTWPVSPAMTPLQTDL